MGAGGGLCVQVVADFACDAVDGVEWAGAPGVDAAGLGGFGKDRFLTKLQWYFNP